MKLTKGRQNSLLFYCLVWRNSVNQAIDMEHSVADRSTQKQCLDATLFAIFNFLL